MNNDGLLQAFISGFLDHIKMGFQALKLGLSGWIGIMPIQS